MDEQQLVVCVKAAKHGSADDFGKLYALYAVDLYRFALWYLKNEADAEDAVQDACVSAFENIRSLRREEKFRVWLFKILSNACKDRLRSKNRQLLFASEDIDRITDLADGKNEEMQHKCEIEELIAALPEQERSIILLSVVAGFSSAEIGDILKLKASTVRSKQMRSLQSLRKQLENEVPKNG